MINVINQFKRKRKVKDEDDEAIIEIESTEYNTSDDEKRNIDVKVQSITQTELIFQTIESA